MRNEIDKKIKQLQSCTLAEYDAMGGHIRNHVMAEQDALASLAQKKCISVFFEKEAPEAVIHEALTNRLVKERLETWMTSPAYRKQRRIIMTYPADSNIGYRYQMDGKSILYTDSERLRDTIQSGVDEEEFNRSVMLINDARRLYILGARSAAYLAGLMGYYFKMMFDNVIIVDANSTSETLEQIYDISDKDVMMGITFPRYSKRTICALQYAKNHGAKTIALTDNMQSPIVEYADCKLIAKSDVMTIVDSLVCPLSVVNAMVTAIALLRKDDVEKRLMALEELWNEYDVYNRSLL